MGASKGLGGIGHACNELPRASFDLSLHHCLGRLSYGI